MTTHALSRLLFLIALLSASSLTLASERSQTITKKQHHLRSGTEPEWAEFKSKSPEGPKLELRFKAKKNSGPETLIIEQDDVKQEWPVRLNGTNLGKLFLMEAPLVHALSIPPGTLREGENILSIQPPKENDDILVGPISIDSRPATQAIGGAALKIEVTENGKPVPCRITVTRRDFTLAAMSALDPSGIALRPGVIYTENGAARVGLIPGRYAIFASRGPEYSVATKNIKLREGETATATLELRREVPTPGWVSCDTHVHTWTFSKHGDATLDERMLTLAGEAIELPIATDHNLVIDYTWAAKSNSVGRYFTPVIGDEVTTARGHFNAFPIEAAAKPPDPKIEPWPKLMEAIRATPGVQFIVLNHPTDTHNGFCPFAPTNFNRVTGTNLRGFDYSFDGVELVNSGALRSDLMETFRCWFALLNHGYRVTGVGASDSHDVSRFIVGQGRTYIRVDDSDLAGINVNEACRSLRAGHASISLGLLADIHVNDRFGMGDLATNLESAFTVTVDIWGPSWARADHLELFANGAILKQTRVTPASDAHKAHFTWTITRPLHDVHLIAIATGPGVISPHWAIPRPYQPNDLAWTPRLLAATNPVWVDADGDGKFTSARGYARQIVDRIGVNPPNLIPALANFDQAVASQVASFCSDRGADLTSVHFQSALTRAPSPVQAGFTAYLQSKVSTAQGETAR